MLVGFIFSDESARKLRPAVVVSARGYARSRREVIVAAITSNVRRRLFGDHVIADWRGAGLLFPSLVTGILRTITHVMVERRLGVMPALDMVAIDRELHRSLAL